MRTTISVCAAIALGALTSTASATVISYDLSNVSGNTWQYDFNVANNSLGSPINEFTLFFDFATFSKLAFVAQPAAFDQPAAVAQPDPGLPAAGFVDFLSSTIGLGAGAALGGFVVQADFSGAGAPGGPTFTVVDPSSFATLDSGNTTANQPAGVPEPGTLALFGVGLLATIFRLRVRCRS